MLGLGMLAALQYTIDLVENRLGEAWGSCTPSRRKNKASTTSSVGPTRSAFSR
jgi:hypothetical protein